MRFLPLIKGECAFLLGKNWLRDIKLDWKPITEQGISANVHSVLHTKDEVDKILKKYKTVLTLN